MNREINFRAKDYQTNKWVYGFLFMGKDDDNRDYAFILQDKGLKVGTAAETRYGESGVIAVLSPMFSAWP